MEGMFQPQPTPYSPFSAYGINSPPSTFPGFQSQPSGLVVDSGGPAVFRDPVFTPAANVNAGRLNFANNNNLTRPYKMEGAGTNDLEVQEALARDFRPDLQVRRQHVYIKSTVRKLTSAGSAGRRKEEQPRHNGRIRQGRPDLCCEDGGTYTFARQFHCANQFPRRCRRLIRIIDLSLEMAIADGGVGLTPQGLRCIPCTTCQACKFRLGNQLLTLSSCGLFLLRDVPAVTE